jgi:hypothetical protein
MAKQELAHDAACRAIPVAWFLPNRPKGCILTNEPKCQAPIHVFHHLTRVKFGVHIQHRQTGGRAHIPLFLNLEQVIFGANVQHK